MYFFPFFPSQCEFKHILDLEIRIATMCLFRNGDITGKCRSQHSLQPRPQCFPDASIAWQRPVEALLIPVCQLSCSQRCRPGGISRLCGGVGPHRPRSDPGSSCSCGTSLLSLLTCDMTQLGPRCLDQLSRVLTFR